MRDTARSGPDRARSPERRVAPPGPSHDVLALQRSIGNRAATALVARREKPKHTVLIGDLGTIPLESVQNSQDGKEVHLSSPAGDHSGRIMQAAINGKHFDDADISVAGGRVHYVLTDVFISQYSSSGAGSGGGAIDSWTLSYGSIKIIHAASGPLPE